MPLLARIKINVELQEEGKKMSPPRGRDSVNLKQTHSWEPVTQRWVMAVRMPIRGHFSCSDIYSFKSFKPKQDHRKPVWSWDASALVSRITSCLPWWFYNFKVQEIRSSACQREVNTSSWGVHFILSTSCRFDLKETMKNWWHLKRKNDYTGHALQKWPGEI